MSADFALARRAKVCAKWRWMLGMQTVKDYNAAPFVETLPDLSAPSTLGCLLALVREAHACPTVWVWFSTAEGWIATRGDGDRIGQGLTEPEARIAALEGAA